MRNKIEKILNYIFLVLYCTLACMMLVMSIYNILNEHVWRSMGYCFLCSGEIILTWLQAKECNKY